jgi:hypothetical protein
VRARQPGETATVFLPAVRPLLALAAELESERDRVVRVHSPTDETGELDEMPEVERLTGPNEWEAIDAEASFAHVLAGGRAVTAEAVADHLEGENDFEDGGLPGLLTPEQTAALLARRDHQLHKRLKAARATESEKLFVGDGGGGDDEPDAVSWEDAGELRREVNALVARVAAASGMPHAMVHAQVRNSVPGPPSSAATSELLARRRDHLMERVSSPRK